MGRTTIIILSLGVILWGQSIRDYDIDTVMEQATILLEMNAERYEIIDDSLRYLFLVDMAEAVEINRYEYTMYYYDLMRQVYTSRNYRHMYLILQRHGYLKQKPFNQIEREYRGNNRKEL